MQKISLDYSKALDFFDEQQIGQLSESVKSAHDALHNGYGAGSEYTGWLDWPVKYDREEFARIKNAAQRIRSDSEIFVVVGIGGSYLGSRAIIEAAGHSFLNLLPDRQSKSPLIIFAGNNMSSSYMADLMDLLDGREVSLNVVSKSGATTESAVAFLLLRDYMEKRYGKKGAASRIYATTDAIRGALRKSAEAEKYESFTIPPNIGGRYSVLTAAGLLPVAVSGRSIEKIMEGAASAFISYSRSDLDDNDCYLYAALRNILYKKNKLVEILVNYEPSLHYLAEWWKQLFGESEGKDGKGIYPVGADFTTDLHSMGQYIQEGLRIMFETVLNVEKPRRDIKIAGAGDDTGEFEFLNGKSVDYVNKQAMKGTVNAHTHGGVPCLLLNIPEISDYYLGNLIYFFEKACAISGYLLGVNPFIQPGVEEYKRNMFALLGKPGYSQK